MCLLKNYESASHVRIPSMTLTKIAKAYCIFFFFWECLQYTRLVSISHLEESLRQFWPEECSSQCFLVPPGWEGLVWHVFPRVCSHRVAGLPRRELWASLCLHVPQNLSTWSLTGVSLGSLTTWQPHMVGHPPWWPALQRWWCPETSAEMCGFFWLGS